MNDFYCAAPWQGLHINPRGDVKTCCASDPNMLGNLNTQSIEKIKELQAHINEIELVYHQDQQGNFNKLWFELVEDVNTNYGR